MNQSLEVLQELGLTPENAFSLYSVSIVLGFENAKALLSSYIQSKLFIRESTIKCLLESVKFENKNWLDFLSQKLIEEFGYFLKNQETRKDLLQVPLDSIIDLLTKDEIRVDSEDDCLDFIIEFIQFRNSLELKAEKIE